MIAQRLFVETETNVGIKVKPSDERSEAYDVMGRATWQRLESIEEVVVEVDDEYTGLVIVKLPQHKGLMTDMKSAAEGGHTCITLECPTRGLLDHRNVFFTDTKGSGIMTHTFKDYESYKGDLEDISLIIVWGLKLLGYGSLSY
jgi:predicted membrane GTPase involved in stress response